MKKMERMKKKRKSFEISMLGLDGKRKSLTLGVYVI
jgi:hypothetical protein